MQSRMHKGDPAIESLDLLHMIETQTLGGARLPLRLALGLFPNGRRKQKTVVVLQKD